MKTAISVILIYILIGLVVYYFQEKKGKEIEPEFFEDVDNEGWLQYFVLSVMLWLPDLIAYIGYVINHYKNRSV